MLVSHPQARGCGTSSSHTCEEQTFQQRKEQHAYKVGMETATNIPEDQRIEKTVFVKAPRALKYGDVVKVIDAIKGAGASPVGLQVDDLP